jgi:hypothetical protein
LGVNAILTGIGALLVVSAGLTLGRTGLPILA